jgi:Ca-activated chloride channel family protein
MNFMVRPGNVQQRQGAEFGNLGSLAPASAPKVLAQTGEEAVQLSKMQREAQDLIRLKDNTRKDAVKRVESKTFYLIDGVWTDSEFKAESQLPETVLVFGSDEYFALLKQNPKLGSYFSLGERVVVVIEGHVYRVNAPTP